MTFALSLIPKGGNECTFYLSSFESVHFDQNDSLSTEESTAKNRL